MHVTGPSLEVRGHKLVAVLEHFDGVERSV